MQMYQFRCKDCGILFEGVIDQQQDSPVYCDFCDSTNVKKICAVTTPVERR